MGCVIRVAKFDLLELDLVPISTVIYIGRFMDLVYFWLKRLCFIILIAISPAAPLVGQTSANEKAKQLETLATHSSGGLSDIPEEIRALRSGPVTQRVKVSSDGVLTIAKSFHCKPFSGQCDTGKPVVATSLKRFSLAALKNGASRCYEINRHVNTLQLFDSECGWSLGFASTADTERAFALLGSLIASARPATASPAFSPAAVAAHAGFKYLVVSFRCEDVADGVRLLSMSEPSPRLLCWLTKSTPDKVEEVCAESMNRLPLFFFDLSLLDTSSFFTLSIPGCSSFLPCSIGDDVVQSVYSAEKSSFESFVKRSPYVGIHFQTMPSFAPIAVVCKLRDEHVIAKAAKVSGLRIKEADWHLFSGLNPVDGIPRGTTSSWVTGMSDTSYDILRTCLFSKELTPAIFAYMIYPEFPSLKKLLNTKSRYQKDLSLEEMICRTSCSLKKKIAQLSEFQGRVLRIALATHELGSPFGEDTDLGYNSWPIALALAEKVGMTEQEKKALHALIDDPSLCTAPKKDKKKKTDFLFSSFAQESRTATEIGICLQQWLQIKACFYEVLEQHVRLSAARKEIALTVKSLCGKYAAILPFGVPRGLAFCKGPLNTRSLYSSYVWEERDAQHRDGLSLKRRREKFEQMLVDGVKTSWKGKFWDWLKKELQNDPLPSNTYLNDDERDAIRATFKEGVLVAPQLPQTDDEVEMMFVIDDWGRVFIGEKKDGNGQSHERGFNHASILGGRPVSCAGKMSFRNRKPTQITDHSGHYRCGPKEIVEALKVFETMGVRVADIKIVAGE